MILQEAVPDPEQWTFTTQILARVAYSPYLKVYRYDLYSFLVSPSCSSIEPTIPTRQHIPYQIEIGQLGSAPFSGPHHFSSARQGCVRSSAHCKVEVEHY